MKRFQAVIASVLLSLLIIVAVLLLNRFVDAFRFRDPEWLILLFLIPAALFYHDRWFRKRRDRIVFSSVQQVKRMRPSLRIRLYSGFYIVRMLALAALILALARPQSGRSEREVETEGVDIILAVDVSTSMRAEDFKPNRLQSVKRVIREFLNKRTADRIGLTIFGAQSFTQCPLTLDYGVLRNLIDKVNFAEREWDGTAIGNGLANAIDLIRESEAKSKVVILLTDGVNNRGEVDPMLAANLANTYNIRVYTIGAGTNGFAMIPYDDPIRGRRYSRMQVQIDEQLLTDIAAQTGGKYYRATNQAELQSIYAEIDQLEKTRINVKEFTRYDELFHHFLMIAALLILLELSLANTVLLKLP